MAFVLHKWSHIEYWALENFFWGSRKCWEALPSQLSGQERQYALLFTILTDRNCCIFFSIDVTARSQKHRV